MHVTVVRAILYILTDTACVDVDDRAGSAHPVRAVQPTGYLLRGHEAPHVSAITESR